MAFQNVSPLRKNHQQSLRLRLNVGWILCHKVQTESFSFNFNEGMGVYVTELSAFIYVRPANINGWEQGNRKLSSVAWVEC